MKRLVELMDNGKARTPEEALSCSLQLRNFFQVATRFTCFNPSIDITDCIHHCQPGKGVR